MIAWDLAFNMTNQQVRSLPVVNVKKAGWYRVARRFGNEQRRPSTNSGAYWHFAISAVLIIRPQMTLPSLAHHVESNRDGKMQYLWQ
jgi:hypothetical protein